MSKKDKKNKVYVPGEDDAIAAAAASTADTAQSEKKEQAPKAAPSPSHDRFSDAVPRESVQSFHFGPRSVPPYKNSPILLEKCGYLCRERALSVPCQTYTEKDAGNEVGTVTRIMLSCVWDKAQRWMDRHPEYASGMTILQHEWEEACQTISLYLKRTLDHPEYTVQEALSIKDLIFQELFIPKANQVVALMRFAILYDANECEALRRRWKKIKKYKYRVPFRRDFYTLFSSEEIKTLNDLGIHSLNALRKKDIYFLKYYLPNHDFEFIVEELNRSFKEDLAARRDKRFKRIPVLLSLLALYFVAGIAYGNKYELIKDAAHLSPYLNSGVIGFFAACLIAYFGIRRARKRRRGNAPEYYYFTKRMGWYTALCIGFTAVLLINTFDYYHRYDDYDANFYYTYETEQTIAVAGLRTEEPPSTVTLPDEIDGKTIVKIHKGIFKDSNVSHVYLPASLTEIGNDAFRNCRFLYSVTQTPAAGGLNISTIGTNAFNGCESLTGVEFLATATHVGKNAFKGCKNLLSPTFTNLQTVGDNAFSGCESFTVVTLPDTVTKLGSGVFDGCVSLQALTLPFLGEDLEHNSNRTLNAVVQSSTLDSGTRFTLTLTKTTEIRSNTFKNCKNVTLISLPESVTEIKAGAFSGADSLSTVNIPGAVTSLQANLFKNCESLVSVIGGEFVTEIGAQAFFGCSSLGAVSFPALQKLGAAAFAQCTSLTEFTMGDALTAIGNEAFMNCSALSTLTCNSVLQTVGERAFFHCISLTSFDIPDTVNKLGSEVLRECHALSSLNISASLTEIPANAFRECYSLTSITVPSYIQAVGNGAFYDCTSLYSVVLEQGVEKIGNKAFYNCESLVNATIPTSVTKIGKNILHNCDELSTLTIPFIGKDVKTPERISYVTDSDELSNVTVTAAESLTKRTFKGCKNLVILSINEGCKEVGYKVVYGCKNLEFVYLPESLSDYAENFQYGEILYSN